MVTVIRVYDFARDRVLAIPLELWRRYSAADRRALRGASMWRAAQERGRVLCNGEPGCPCRICAHTALLRSTRRNAA